MRYGATRKAETRRSVLRAAALAVRAKGPDGVSVAEVMAEAGLTHGGFYAHFASKEALIAAAVQEAFEQSRRRLSRLTGELAGEAALGVYIDGYMSLDHRAHPERGCPLAALGSELPRQGAAVRAVFDAGLRRMIDHIAGWLPMADEAARLDLAGSLVAEMAGAVTLSRAIAEETIAARFLEQARLRLRHRAAG